LPNLANLRETFPFIGLDLAIQASKIGLLNSLLGSPLLFDTCYHIYNRGTNGGNIFIEERNYEYFLKLYEKHIAPVADTFAYCLLRNHFHVDVRIKSEKEILDTIKTLKVSTLDSKHGTQDSFANRDEDSQRKPLGFENYVSQRFSNFFNAYAKSINIGYGRTGSLFEHPFGRVPITTDRQFWNVIAYIHQNPQKHGFVKDFRDWKYSSYGIILSGKRTSINRDEVMKWFGSREEYLSLHNEWVTDAQSKWFAENDFD
jgi:putative transposase